jgi:hypothetical protein
LMRVKAAWSRAAPSATCCSMGVRRSPAQAWTEGCCRAQEP